MNIAQWLGRGAHSVQRSDTLYSCVFKNRMKIDSRERLFHRQGDEQIPQTIKDTIPYFLGAVDEDHFIKQAELDVARSELRELEVKLQSQKTGNRELC